MLERHFFIKTADSACWEEICFIKTADSARWEEIFFIKTADSACREEIFFLLVIGYGITYGLYIVHT